jgi:hypothetical protein
METIHKVNHIPTLDEEKNAYGFMQNFWIQ